jgi:CheY-like chemotaxis protein
MREKPLVLLVDDEEVFLEIASVKLRTEGFETAMAQDVRDALVMAERLLPDIVLSDIFMPPGPNGWEFALELRRNPKTCAIKIAFFTSLRDPWLELSMDRTKLAAELGPVTFLSKTDDVDALAERVRRLL